MEQEIETAVPQIQEPIVETVVGLLGAPVVDVPVIMQLKFLQSLPIDSEMVHAIQLVHRQIASTSSCAQCNLCRVWSTPR